MALRIYDRRKLFSDFEIDRRESVGRRDKDKASFLVYKSYYAPIKNLSNEQLGRLFRAIFEYQINNEENVDNDIFMAFSFFKNQFDLDQKKYEKICEERRKNGKKGGLAKAATVKDSSKSYQKVAKGSKTSKSYQSVANVADNVNVNVNVNEIDKESLNVNVKNDPKYQTSKGISILDVIHKSLKDKHSDKFYLKEIKRIGADRFYELLKEFLLNNEFKNIKNISAYFTKSLKEIV